VSVSFVSFVAKKVVAVVVAVSIFEFSWRGICRRLLPGQTRFPCSVWLHVDAGGGCVDNGAGVEQTQQQLISRAVAGKESACTELYESHVGLVAAYFRRSGFDISLTADLTQETFVNVFGALGGYDPQRGAFRTWLSAIAHNVARKYWRRRVTTDSFDPELADAMFAVRDEGVDTAEQREENEAVDDCVSQLDPTLGELVGMRYIRGMTTRGIAAEANMPESTVRSRLGEALERIEKCLRGKGIVR